MTAFSCKTFVINASCCRLVVLFLQVCLSSHCTNTANPLQNLQICQVRQKCAQTRLVLTLLYGINQVGLFAQGSVWGSGSAGTLCALAALLAGHADFWQVAFLMFYDCTTPTEHANLCCQCKLEGGRENGKMLLLACGVEMCGFCACNGAFHNAVLHSGCLHIYLYVYMLQSMCYIGCPTEETFL